MSKPTKLFGIVCATALLVAAQGRGAQPRNPAQSPASQAPPATATAQTYTAAQISAGEGRFAAECGFCHGRDTAGGESGPDLTRSTLVASDNRGDKIAPVLRDGRTGQGMPAFKLSATDVDAIVAYIHDQKTKAEANGGGRRSVEDADLATGNAAAGQRYFDSACAKCHSPSGDLKGIGTKYTGLALVQRMLYPSGRPAPARPKVTLTVNGQTIAGTVAAEDEFSIDVADAQGARKKYDKAGLNYKVDDPMSAHFDQLGKYTDADMHNVYAFLATLK